MSVIAGYMVAPNPRKKSQIAPFSMNGWCVSANWWIEEAFFAPYLQRFAAFYYNRGAQWGKEVAINYKHAAFPTGTAVWDIERGQLAGKRDHFWQTDTAVAKNSWGYTENQEYKEA